MKAIKVTLPRVVSDEKILAFVLSQPEVQGCAEGLGQLALDSGSRDNVSCIVIEAVEVR